MKTTLVLPVMYVLASVACLGAGTQADVYIKGVPHVRQKPDFCGEACVEMILRKLGHAVTQDDVFNASGADPVLGRGCVTRELAAAMTTLGFQTGPVYHSAEAAKADADVEAQWKALHADLAAGIASIVCMHYDDTPKSPEHFRLILGYDSTKDEVVYNEPAVDGAVGCRMKRALFLKLWPLKYSAERWTLIRLRCEPGRIVAPRRTAGFSSADYCQRIRELREKVPAIGFTILVQPPFVVLGDEAPEQVRARSVNTVKWAVDRIGQDFGMKEPEKIIAIWLFKDEASYEKHTREIFNMKTFTPYGFYSDAYAALIMNIATGGGTLIHEILHPYTRGDFPKCPPWFFEGLGSLYEQCRERDGCIVGLTNWRLEGLQNALRRGPIPTFQELTGMSSATFYGDDRGLNYAQARYLCYYLQEKGVLVKYYKAVKAACATDPTGYETLKKFCGAGGMGAFEKEWKEYVLKLTFP
jgi:hypothetical protein